GFRADLEDLRGTLELEVLDHGHDVAVREQIAMGVLDDALARGCFGRFFQGPFVAACEALVAVRVGQYLGHFAQGADGIAHGTGKTNRRRPELKPSPPAKSSTRPGPCRRTSPAPHKSPAPRVSGPWPARRRSPWPRRRIRPDFPRRSRPARCACPHSRAR